MTDPIVLLVCGIDDAVDELYEAINMMEMDPGQADFNRLRLRLSDIGKATGDIRGELQRRAAIAYTRYGATELEEVLSSRHPVETSETT